MPKYKTTTTLVIVESPAKCKKIEEYLGPGYKCIATYGHLQTIQTIKNIDIENNFKPTYSIINEEIKKKQIERIRKEIKNVNDILLASDADREGEMISFTIIELFKLPANTKRITFNEITETALRKAIENPRTIDINLVNAQQTRQILDILVGFKISPILWKLISTPKGKEHTLSAGRCQTPALRIVYENQKDIDEITEKKIYKITGYFTNCNLGFDLKPEGRIEDEDEVINFLEESAKFSHIYTCSKPIKVLKQQPEPFNTSILQQVASNELHYSPKETMKICQTLYENGYITYMRTDSKKYSEDFINLTKEYIKYKYSEEYINPNLNLYSNNNSQDAHEAIRPTDISLQELKIEINSKERKMYKLIWKNTLESCMSNASYYSVTSKISAPLNMYYTYNSELIDFPGWKIVENNFSRVNKDYQYLQTIKNENIINYKKIISNVTLKGTKLHYTEARLVQILEKKGIGRPSTFSSIIDKIQERGYVKKEDIKGKQIDCKDFELVDGEINEVLSKREFGNEKGKLVIQHLGIIVMEFLDKNFSPLFNYEYSGLMETSLDKISKGELDWVEICKTCNNEINDLIEKTRSERKFEYIIDENHTYIVGKYGPVIKCIADKNGKEEISFKSIKKDIDIKKIENGDYNVNDIVEEYGSFNKDHILGKYEDNDVIIKKGKFGLYIKWGNNFKSLKEFGNRQIENIRFDEVKHLLEEGSSIIRVINESISIRKGPKGDYLFYKNKQMKKPLFHDIKSFINDTKEDYKTCDLYILKSWINEKYNL